MSGMKPNLDDNRPVIVVVCGVAGVGKTTIGRLLAQELGWEFYDADNFHYKVRSSDFGFVCNRARLLSMRRNDISEITGQKRFQSPVVTPQALAWDGKQLWVSSRDLGTLYKIDIDMWKVVEEIDPPG